MIRLHGYSERGLVNALFESMQGAPDPDLLWGSLLQSMRMWWTARGLILVQAADKFPPIKDVHIYVEPSLSQFGNPDALVLVDYEDDTSNAKCGDAFFFEAKLETFASSIRNEDLDKNCSSILHELFLKARFCELAGKPAPVSPLPALQNLLLTEGVKIYQKDNIPRKIGNDAMVVELANAIAERTAYFVSLTTDKTPPASGHSLSFWSKEMQANADKMREIHDKNLSAAVVEHPNLVYIDPENGGWIDHTLMLGWDQVRAWAKKYNLAPIQKAIRENRSKFKLDSVQPPPSHIEALFKSTCGLVSKAPRTGASPGTPWRLKEKGKTVATYRVTGGLDGQPWIYIYFSKGGTGVLTEHELKQLGTVDLKTLQQKAMSVGWMP